MILNSEVVRKITDFIIKRQCSQLRIQCSYFIINVYINRSEKKKGAVNRNRCFIFPFVYLCLITTEVFHFYSHLTRLLLCFLFSVPPVFVLHFVEGLPDNDVRIYTFNFKGKRYSVTMVIQYNHQLKHFVTWICNSKGRYFETNTVIVFFPCFTNSIFSID